MHAGSMLILFAVTMTGQGPPANAVGPTPPSARVEPSSGPIILDFFATWCGPCKLQAPEIEKLIAKGFPVKKIDVDKDKPTASKYKVDRIPTVIIADGDGNQIERKVGVTPAVELAKLFNETAKRPKPSPGPEPDPPTGVITEKLPQIQPGMAWYGGAPTPDFRPGIDPVGAKGKPDVYLTVIGKDVDRNGVIKALDDDPTYRALKTQMGDRLAVHAYDPTNPMVTVVNLPAGGKPDVVIQDASGKELYRRAADPGPGAIVREIRKADPSYKPGGGKLSGEQEDWTYRIAGALAVLAILAALRGRSQS